MIAVDEHGARQARTSQSADVRAGVVGAGTDLVEHVVGTDGGQRAQAQPLYVSAGTVGEQRGDRGRVSRLADLRKRPQGSALDLVGRVVEGFGERAASAYRVGGRE